MKPQQAFTNSDPTPPPANRPVCGVFAGLPALGVIALAIASSVVLTLGGCASSAGIASTAQTLAPLSVGRVAVASIKEQQPAHHRRDASTQSCAESIQKH